MKVRIDAGGREVEIECSDTNTSPKEIAAEVLAMWQATVGSPSGAGPAYGFSAERKLRDEPSSTMRRPVDVPE